MFKDFAAFITDGYVRASWIAFLTLWVLWGLMYVVRHVVGDPYTTAYLTTAPGAAPGIAPGAATTTTGVAPTTDEEAAAMKANRLGFLNRFGATSPISRRVWDAHRLLKENLFMLLSVLLINTFSKGSTRAVFILVWIFFAFTVLFVLLELIWQHRFLRLGYSILFYALGLAIAGLAFKQGW
ncbi:hypothetical protein BX666DRAFT_1158214 [Dichotomocladium elegans]|nr:hypothetical protein BX666DRAFT_1158214 [Dichotomocladium elegans]